MGDLAGGAFWRAKIKGDKLLIKSDSTVALALSKKLSSSTPSLNWVGPELGIHLEMLQVMEIVAHHLPGRLNEAADWLSRFDTRGPMPKGLSECRSGRPMKLGRLKRRFPLRVRSRLCGGVRPPPAGGIFDDL